MSHFRWWPLADVLALGLCCPLSGVKRTCRLELGMSANDPKLPCHHQYIDLSQINNRRSSDWYLSGFRPWCRNGSDP
jgi:hypothetical protein